MKFKFTAIIVLTLTATMVLQACSKGSSSKSSDKPVQSSTVQKAIETPKTSETTTPAVQTTTPAVQTTTPAASPSPTVEKISIHSDSLNKDMPSNIYLPFGYDKKTKYPVLYLISYTGASESAAIPSMRLQNKADQLLAAGKIKPLIIVTIKLESNFKEDTYANYIMKDLVSYIDSHYSTISSKEGRYIGGFSAGGWTALFIGLQHPDLFSKVGGHSASIIVGDSTLTYPTAEFRKTHDPFMLAASGKLSGTSVHLDSGEQDALFKPIEALYKTLQEQHVNAEFHHSKGVHNGEYWTSQLEDYLMFYSGNTK